MDEELTTLAEAGAAAVVIAMGTDLWERTRTAVIGLFHRAGQREAVEARLDGNAALMRDAAVPDGLRRMLFAFWGLELADLLRRDPTCREPLARVACDVRSAPAPWSFGPLG